MLCVWNAPLRPRAFQRPGRWHFLREVPHVHLHARVPAFVVSATCTDCLVCSPEAYSPNTSPQVNHAKSDPRRGTPTMAHFQPPDIHLRQAAIHNSTRKPVIQIHLHRSNSLSITVDRMRACIAIYLQTRDTCFKQYLNIRGRGGSIRAPPLRVDWPTPQLVNATRARPTVPYWTKGLKYPDVM